MRAALKQGTDYAGRGCAQGHLPSVLGAGPTADEPRIKSEEAGRARTGRLTIIPLYKRLAILCVTIPVLLNTEWRRKAHAS